MAPSKSQSFASSHTNSAVHVVPIKKRPFPQEMYTESQTVWCVFVYRTAFRECGDPNVVFSRLELVKFLSMSPVEGSHHESTRFSFYQTLLFEIEKFGIWRRDGLRDDIEFVVPFWWNVFLSVVRHDRSPKIGCLNCSSLAAENRFINSSLWLTDTDKMVTTKTKKKLFVHLITLEYMADF